MLDSCSMNEVAALLNVLLQATITGGVATTSLKRAARGGDADASCITPFTQALMPAMSTRYLVSKAMMPCRMTVLAVRGKGSFSVLGMAEMPMWASPFASLVLTSVLVPQASFLGHLAGIVVGFAVCISGLGS